MLKSPKWTSDAASPKSGTDSKRTLRTLNGLPPIK
jgi:hypothetical protein